MDSPSAAGKALSRRIESGKPDGRKWRRCPPLRSPLPSQGLCGTFWFYPYRFRRSWLGVWRVFQM